MIEMFKNSVVLFAQGRLFKDVGAVLRQTLIGVAIATIVLLGLAMFGAPLWLAVVVASVISGAIQPLLFKDLRYA